MVTFSTTHLAPGSMEGWLTFPATCASFCDDRYDKSTSTENGDYCAWNYGTTGVAFLDPPNNNYPISNVMVGGRSYLVQMNYNPPTGTCVQVGGSVEWIGAL